MAVNKRDYDEVVPSDFRDFLGRDHYAWAVRQLVSYIAHILPSKQPLEYVFQWMERRNPARREIEAIMDQIRFIAEKEGLVGIYSEPHFRKSEGIPGLQCVDAVGWVCYQYSLLVFRETPLKKWVYESWRDFEGHKGAKGWLHAFTMVREKLQRSIDRALADGRALEFFKQWKEAQNYRRG